MGIRKIEDEIDLKEAMKKKATELKMKDMQAKPSVEKFTKDKLRELAKQNGALLALTPELREEVKELQKKYNIPSSKIVTEQITEQNPYPPTFSSGGTTVESPERERNYLLDYLDLEFFS